MATIRAKTLDKILSPVFRTGGKADTEVPEQPKKPGVPTVTSAFSRADQRQALTTVRGQKKCVVGVTPFVPEDPSNAGKMERYSKRAALDGANRNEAMLMANRSFLTMSSYSSSIERDDAFMSLLSWIARCDMLAVYVDFGITPAMQVAINVAEAKNRKIEYRSIGAVS